jgi:hypothetical protein
MKKNGTLQSIKRDLAFGMYVAETWGAGKKKMEL